MSRRQRAYFSAIVGPLLLVLAFLTVSPALAATLEIQVNYALDWVGGVTDPQDPGVSVVVTVTNELGTPKAEAIVTAETSGDFFVLCEDWIAGGCPDIVPGDRVQVWAGGLLNEIDPVGSIRGTIDAEANVVTGELNADWFSGQLNVACELWEAEPVYTTAATAGGSFTCDLSPWDPAPYQAVALRYYEPDGDQVINQLTWPWVRVNYGYDQVGANYGEGHSFSITVTDSVGSVKATGTAESVLNGGWGGDGFEGVAWTPARPDIVPGDFVYFQGDDGYTNQLQIGEIGGTVDVEADTVSGPITAPWFVTPATLDVACHPWGAWSSGIGDAPVKHSSASPDGVNPFTCSWDPASEWDIQAGQEIAVMYFEPDGDRVIDVERHPLIVAWIGPESGGDRFVWGHGAEPYASVEVTVTTDIGAFVAGATAPTDRWGNWSTGSDLPAGSLAFWNVVEVELSSGITDTLTVYSMSGEASPATDVVTVSAAGQPFFSVDLEVCPPIDGCQWFGLGEIGASGVVTSDLHADYGYDLLPGASLHAQMAVENGHQLRYSWGLPAPELGVTKWHSGGTTRPGGVAVYGVRLGNWGGGSAESVQVVDTLPHWTSYAADTSGLPVTIGPGKQVTWDVGTLDPGGELAFAVTLDVDSGTPTGEGTVGANCLAIETTSPGDWNPENDESCAAPVGVWADEVEIGVDKWASPSDPVPGGEFDYYVRWCNNRAAAAGPVVLTDTLPVGVTLLDWDQSTHEPFWIEISATDGELVLYAAGLPGERCEELRVRVEVDSQVASGTVLSNHVELEASGDIDPSNNWRVDDGVVVGEPRLDLALWKRLEGSTLVPGGRAGFAIDYANNGNVDSAVVITDTLPPGMTYVRGWWAGYTPWAEEPLPDPTIVGNQLVWNLPDAPVSRGYGFGFELAIDEAINPQAGLVNCATVAGGGQDGTPADNTSCVAFDLNQPGANLRVEKKHSWQGDATLAYEVRFDNVGDQPVADVVITDTLPVGTAWNGWWDLGFDGGRLVGDVVAANDQLVWNLTELLPGETGWLWFEADLDDPGAPLQWYTNTVEITTPAGDTAPADNVAEDVAFSGGEVRWFEIQVAGRDVWGFAPRGPVTITTESEQVVLEVDGNFGWTFDQPLLPGQTITVTADAGLAPVVIEIPDPFDALGSSIEERVWGQIDQLDGETIEVFFHGGPTLLGETDGSGFFEVVFPDIPRGASGEVRYATEVAYADVVFHRIWQTPDVVVDVNYAHDWVAGRAAESESVQVVLGEVGLGPVAQAVAAPDDMGFFFVGCGDWDDGACPDILPGHVVEAEASTGFTTTVEIGAITGVLDVEADTLSGTVEAAWFTEPLAGSCEVWVEGGPAIEFEVEPNGGSYQCDLAAVWDLVPGQDVAVRYREPDGDSVIDVYREPAPWLRIEKSGVGDAAEGGNFRYQIAVWNDGGASAESVVVTDTLPVGSTYITDTSGLPMSGAGAGPVVWQAGTLDPGQRLEFDLYVDVAAPVSEPITNTVEVTTATPFDAGEPADKVSEWVEEVQPNDTHLTVAKWSRTPDPAPGEDFLFVVNVCNEGTTGSTEVTLTDTFVPLLALVDWQTGNPAWREVSRVDGELVLAIPSIASNSCSRVRMTMFLDAAAEVGQLLTNSAVIAADNDLETNDNEAFWEALVTEPRLNLAVEKRFDSGVLVPGGSIRYTVDYANNGNVAVAGPVFITDTFPAGTTFVSAWHNTWWGGYDFPPTVLTPELAVWELSGLDNSVGGNFDVLLTIDEDVLPGTLLRNWVEISPQEGEASYDDNTSGWDELVRESGVNLRVVKEHDWNDDRSVLAYDVRFDNIGTDPVASVAITDTLPAGTSWDGTWSMDFDWDRLDGDIVAGGGQLVWHFTEIRPGESGHLRFGAALESPQAPLDFYTNTVEITVPAGEIDLDDNVYEDVAAGSGEVAGIDIEKLTNGVDADTAPGPEILVGSPVTWTYTVSNIGSVDLSQIEITDDRLGTICTITSLQTGDPPATCTATGVAEEGPYGNVGMVVGHPPTGNPVADTDASHYVGGTLIFADEFESGDTSAWDGRAPP